MDFNEHPALVEILVRLNLLPSSVVKGIGWRKSAKKVGASLSDEDLHNFERRLDDILEDSRREIEERVYLISLQKIRERLGKDWPRSEKEVHATVSAILDARLSPQDIHIKYDEMSYLMVFASLGPKDAQLKCAAICEEILRKVCRREPISELIDVNKITVNGVQDVLLEALPNVEDILVAVADRSLESGRSGPAGASRDGPAKTEAGENLEENIQFIFRPLLTVQHSIVSTFMCVPVRPVKGGFASGYDVLDDPADPIQIFELDLLTLETGAREVRSLLKQDKRSLVSVPVHFETLASNRRRTDYLRSANTLIDSRKNLVLFEIVEFPDSIPYSRIAELVSLLRTQGRAVMARFSIDHADFRDFDLSGLHAVGFDLFSSHEPESVLMKKMEAFVQNAKKRKLKTYVLGLKSISLYTATVTEGFDYISGHVLASTVKEAENFSEFSLDTPYQEVIESSDRS